jgi:hypothetical protein
VNSDEEENIERLLGAVRCGFDGLNWGRRAVPNIVTNGIWDWWSEEGKLELELLTVAMDANRGREKETIGSGSLKVSMSDFEMSSTCSPRRW